MPTIDKLREKYELDYFFDGRSAPGRIAPLVMRHFYTVCNDHIKEHTS
jgi:hypothetical protein